ncbi:MAG: hypothetical protein WBO06_11175 [Gammaproteobacteria bacterium]
MECSIAQYYDTMPFHCYSQRLLNPFRGTVNCIRYKSAEAVTADGVKWDIYVSHDGLLKGLPYDRKTQVTDIRYGSWSRKSGLKRGPLYPSDDFKRLEDLGTRAYEHLIEVHDAVPFPFQDSFELWLLDTQARPLVLLDSAVEQAAIDLEQAPAWRPGMESRRSFTSQAAGKLGIDSTQAGAIADYLAMYINNRGGPAPRAQLFARGADGRGTGLSGIDLPDELCGRVLEAQQFPVLLLDTRHHDAVHMQLVNDFICWLAPWLLLLPSLDTATRQACEEHARIQPLKIAQHYHLYPEILNQAIFDAARVEARLRGTIPEKKTGETIMSTFYLELGAEQTK